MPTKAKKKRSTEDKLLSTLKDVHFEFKDDSGKRHWVPFDGSIVEAGLPIDAESGVEMTRTGRVRLEFRHGDTLELETK